MKSEKLSISLEADLAETIRASATKTGVSVSSWISDASAQKARQLALREALDEYAKEFGSLSEERIDELVAEARKTSRSTGPALRTDQAA
jgi:hypothetical protein